MQGDQRFAISRAKEALAGNHQAMRASNWNVESSLYLKFGRTEDDNLSGLLNVCVDVLTGRIVHSPARAAGKRNCRDHRISSTATTDTVQFTPGGSLILKTKRRCWVGSYARPLGRSPTPTRPSSVSSEQR